ncbi:MAG: hypothetical protein AAGE85_16620 [Pseudomonadota bacterium]
MNNEEKQKNYDLAEKLLSEQNFPAAVAVGAAATVLGAAAYTAIVAKWPFAHGFVTAGIGIVIGLSMQFPGRGISMKFDVAAAVYAITGCILGNLSTVITALGRATGDSPIDVLRNNPLSVLAERFLYNVSFVDLIYWFIAVFSAVFLAKRPLSRSERLAIGQLKLRS